MDADFIMLRMFRNWIRNWLDEYYYAKLQLFKWEKQEQELKEQIKHFMMDKNIHKLNTEHMFLNM